MRARPLKSPPSPTEEQCMPRLFRRGVVLSALLLVVPLTSMLGASSAHATIPVPKAPAFGAAIEPLASYEGAATCDPVARPGTVDLENLIKASYGSTSFGITRSCTGATATSEHNEGRALDWMINANVPAQKAVADSFIAWLLATDKYGNKDAMARRLGIMYIIWDTKMWRAYEPGWGWKPYTGAEAHTDHVHFSLDWDGAMARTSFYSGTALTTPNCAVSTVPGTAPAISSAGQDFVPLAPTQIAATASGLGTGRACRVSAPHWSGDKQRLDVHVLGAGGVPTAGVSDVVLAVSATSNAPAVITTWPTNSSMTPIAAAYVPARYMARNVVTVPVGASGDVSFGVSAGASFLSVYVLGYYRVHTSASYHAVPDTLVNLGTTTTATIAAHADLTVSLAGVAGVPTSGVTSTDLVVATHSPTVSGGLSLRPLGSAAPAVDQVLYPPGKEAVSEVPVGTSADGEVVLRNDGTTPVSVSLALAGWAGPGTSTIGTPATTFHAMAPGALINTYANAGISGALTSARVVNVGVRGHVGIPVVAKAVVLEMRLGSPSADDSMTVWPSTSAKPTSMSLTTWARVGDLETVHALLGTTGVVSVANVGGTAPLIAQAVGYYD